MRRARWVAWALATLSLGATIAGPAAAEDPARVAARRLARHFASVPNFRGTYRGPAVWRIEPRARWSISPEAECLARLQEAGVTAHRMRWTPTVVPTPVEVRGPVGGVRFVKTRPVPLYLSCEMAVRLPTIARVLRERGVTRVDVMSAYRREPRTSFHSAGLALDLSAFHTPRGEVVVEDHFELAPDTPTCRAPAPEGWRARLLWEVACELAETGRFSTVLTPAYGRGHQDHFHLDARPNDARVFVR